MIWPPDSGEGPAGVGWRPLSRQGMPSPVSPTHPCHPYIQHLTQSSHTCFSRLLNWCPWLIAHLRRGKRFFPVLLPGKSLGQRSLMGYSPWGRKGLDVTECTHTPLYITALQSCVSFCCTTKWISYVIIILKSILPSFLSFFVMFFLPRALWDKRQIWKLY